MCYFRRSIRRIFSKCSYVSCPPGHRRTYVSITPYLVGLIFLLYPHSSTVYATAFFMAHPCPETPVANYGKNSAFTLRVFPTVLDLFHKSSTVALSFLSFPKLLPPKKPYLLYHIKHPISKQGRRCQFTSATTFIYTTSANLLLHSSNCFIRFLDFLLFTDNLLRCNLLLRFLNSQIT